MDSQQQQSKASALLRVQFWYALIVILFAICMVRAFYLQVIRHGYYEAAAQVGQHKEYEISPDRGAIRALDGSRSVPIVLSHKLYTIYTDPELVKDAEEAADAVQATLGGDRSAYMEAIQSEGRYAVLAKKVSEEQKEALLKHKLPGIGAQAQAYRTYPQGSLAAQLIGFVDDSGEGRYGVEQALQDVLAGSPGELKAVTDVRGVPLAASDNNIRKKPVPGRDIVLTIDIGMQKQVERLLEQGIKHAQAPSGSAVVMEAKTGAIKAMANYPSYDPAEYFKVEDASVFNNMANSSPLEIGSIMKPLTVAAALDMGVIHENSSFFDEREYEIGDAVVRNIEQDGGRRQKNIHEILNLSLNTGATWLLMQMGGGELNKQGREAWYGYMTERFRFGHEAGIEQYDPAGHVPRPNEGPGLNITYANTSFGQAMTATLVQTAGAYAAALNGGTYYKPYLVHATVDHKGNTQKVEPKVLKSDVVSPKVSDQLRRMLEYVVDNHRFSRKFNNTVYSVGGKTGTAQIAKPSGGYYDDKYNGTYAGFVGGNEAEYIIVVRVNEPKIPGYAGSQAAQPLFGDIAHMLIDNFNVPSKAQ